MFSSVRLDRDSFNGDPSFLGYLSKESPPIQERMIKILRRIYLLVDLPSMILFCCFRGGPSDFKRYELEGPWLT